MAAFRMFINGSLYLLCLLICCKLSSSLQEKSFWIDYSNNTFIKDGQPFRYISGSIHYQRVPYQYWDDRLHKMAAAGLNAIQTYVAWNAHEPTTLNYDFSGQNDIVQFLQTAQLYNLSVILRPGPYICAEWEFGGLPAWLLASPDIKVRTSDPQYIKAVDRWLTKLYSVIKPMLHTNGGPIITVQIENEYGSFYACDYDYLRFLRQKAISELGSDVVLFTTDGDGVGYLKCGTLEGLYTTVDFGVTYNPAANFKVQREWEPQGPLVNSEYYTGWLDHWGQNHSVTDMNAVAHSLDLMLALGANVNMYMFEGGTNFAFWSGANYSPYGPVPTSYDYDAALTEAGDITDKYEAIRKVISKYNPTPLPVPPSTPKADYGKIQMKFLFTVQAYVNESTGIESAYPICMELLHHYYGFVLYRHKLTRDVANEPLNLTAVRDRAYVSIGSRLTPTPVGVVERESATPVLSVTANAGQYLHVLVENQGRINYGNNIDHNRKGLIGNVTLSNDVLTGWDNLPVIFEDQLQTIQSLYIKHRHNGVQTPVNLTAPAFYMGVLNLTTDPMDTYFDMSNGWQKGQLFINGHNLGRYWPKMGPQVRLYVPKYALKKGDNTVILLELESSPCSDGYSAGDDCYATFKDKPYINETVYPSYPGRGDDFRFLDTKFDLHAYH